MSAYLLRRLGETVVTVLLVTMFIFVIMRLLPGDPVSSLIQGGDGEITPEQEAAARHALGLDRPWPEQYVRWLGGVFQGDWGRTVAGRAPVSDVIRARLPVTLQLAVLTWVLTMALAIPVGIVSALKRNSWLDVSITTGALAGLATPNFVVALLLIIVFAFQLQWLPPRGYAPLTDPAESLKHFALPVITLATAGMASIARQTRSAMLEVLREDYIRTARAKGLRHSAVILRHTMKNALLPIVTIAGLQVGGLISGSIIIETVFGIPGMGGLTINAVRTRDYNVIQILVLLFAVMTVLGNLLADVAYTRMDPRIRLS